MANKKILPLLLVVILLLCGAGFCYAAVSSAGVENTFSTGGISIKVETDTNEIIDIENPEISYIPEITNNAESCYLRVKILANTKSGSIDITQYIYGLNDKWEMIGDYIYLKEPMEYGEKSILCDGFYFPEEWEYLNENKLSVFISAEAIQEANFIPDYSSKKPWGDVIIKKSHITDEYEVSEVSPDQGQPINIVYENAISGVTITADNMFENIKFMPGDSYDDSITVNNSTSKETYIFFRSSYTEDNKLLDVLNMDIEAGDSMFYSGSVASESLKEFTKIITLKPGEKKDIKVKLTLSAEVDNAYQINKDMATWYFAAEQEPDPIKTGDTFIYGFFCIICFASAIGIAIVCRKKSNENI